MEELEHNTSVSLILTGFSRSLLRATTIESTLGSIWRQPLLPTDAAIVRSATANPLVYGWMPQITVRPRRIAARKGQSVSIHCQVFNASRVAVFQGLQERRLVEETNLESFSCRLTPFRLSDDLPSGAEEHVIIRAEGRGGVVEEMVTVKLVD